MANILLFMSNNKVKSALFKEGQECSARILVYGVIDCGVANDWQSGD